MKVTPRRWLGHVLPILFCATGAVGALGSGGCIKSPTEIVVGIATDIPTPGSLSRVEMVFGEVDDTEVKGPYKWFIDPRAVGHLVLPGSFGISSPDGSEPTVRVDVWGYKSDADTKPIVFRSTRVKLASEQTLFMRMGLLLSCTQNGAGIAPFPCPEGQTCIEGVCKTNLVDPRTLKAYSPERVDNVECQGTFINTESHEAITSNAQCPTGERCQEGTCYKILDPGPADGGTDGGSSSMLAYAAQCGAMGDCQSGLSCGSTEPGAPSLCHQVCKAEADCTMGAPQMTPAAVNVTSALAACIGGQFCSFPCNPIGSFNQPGCPLPTTCRVLTGTTFTEVDTDCGPFKSGAAPNDLCTTSSDCGPGQDCSPTGHCRIVCRMGQSPSDCSGVGEGCTPLEYGPASSSSMRFGLCCKTILSGC